MAEPAQSDTPSAERPPIRRPVLFYTCVGVAFGLLGAATLALTGL